MWDVSFVVRLERLVLPAWFYLTALPPRPPLHRLPHSPAAQDSLAEQVAFPKGICREDAYLPPQAGTRPIILSSQGNTMT